MTCLYTCTNTKGQLDYTGTNTKGQLDRMFCFDGGLKEWPVVASIF